MKTIIKDVKYLPHPFGIAVHDQYVYWTNWEYKSLLRTNKYDGSYVETVQRDLTSPMDIKLYDSNVQPDLGMCFSITSLRLAVMEYFILVIARSVH